MWKACRPLCFHIQTMLKILGVFFAQEKNKKIKNPPALCHIQLIIQIKFFIWINSKTLSEHWYTIGSKCPCWSLHAFSFSSLNSQLDQYVNQARSLCQRAAGGSQVASSWQGQHTEREPFTLTARVTSSPVSFGAWEVPGENLQTAKKRPWCPGDSSPELYCSDAKALTTIQHNL